MPRTVPLVRSGDGSAVLPGGLQRRASVGIRKKDERYGYEEGSRFMPKPYYKKRICRTHEREPEGDRKVQRVIYSGNFKRIPEGAPGDFRRKAEEAMEGRGKEHVEGAPGGTCFWLGRPVHRGPGQK